MKSCSLFIYFHRLFLMQGKQPESCFDFLLFLKKIIKKKFKKFFWIWVYCFIVEWIKCLVFTRFQVKKKNFFHNFFPIMLFGVVGVFISCAIVTVGNNTPFPIFYTFVFLSPDLV